MSLLEEIIAYKKEPCPLKGKYLEFIQDKSHPLVERWAVFCEAPREWQQERQWIVHFETEKLLPDAEISWYDEFYVDRHETVEMANFVDVRLYEHLLDLGEVNVDAIVAAFKEEVLDMNLYSFINDW